MKKLKRFFKELWMERQGLVSIFAYILVVGWFGYTLRFIAISDLVLLPKILLLGGGCILAIFNIIGLINFLSDDDE